MRRACWLGAGQGGRYESRETLFYHDDPEQAVTDHDVAFWLVDASQTPGKAEQTIRQLRRHEQFSIYLRPIVLLTQAGFRGDWGQDASLPVSELGEAEIARLSARFEPVNQWLDQAGQVLRMADTGLMFRLLRIFASRGQAFEPMADASIPAGFRYPLLNALLDDGGDLLRVLQVMEQQHLIQGDFHTKAHFCTHCGCAFLNFLEICPRCQAEDLKQHELIHHFRCAYVGEAPEFGEGDNKICPKCDHALRHIGVDYDKPSSVYQCNGCGHRFQEPVVTTRCYQCQRKTDPEQQTLRIIKRYQATATGHHAALFGLDSLFSSLLETDFNLVRQEEFKRFLEIERARIERYKKSSTTLVFLQLDVEKIYLELGEKAAHLFGEITALFKTLLRNSDLISSFNESLFLLLLVETTEANAATAVERFLASFRPLLKHNIDREVAVRSQLEALTPETDLQSSLDRFLS